MFSEGYGGRELHHEVCASGEAEAVSEGGCHYLLGKLVRAGLDVPPVVAREDIVGAIGSSKDHTTLKERHHVLPPVSQIVAVGEACAEDIGRVDAEARLDASAHRHLDGRMLGEGVLVEVGRVEVCRGVHLEGVVVGDGVPRPLGVTDNGDTDEEDEEEPAFHLALLSLFQQPG